MTKPSMSHHFAVLKEADLIRSRREGQQIYYSLNTTVLEDVMARIWDLFGAEQRERKVVTMSRPYWIIAVALAALAGGSRPGSIPSLPDASPRTGTSRARSTATATKTGRSS